MSVRVIDDTIYRQDAIDAIHKNYDSILDFKSDGRTVAYSFEDIINALPSAQPERKTGKWVLETFQIRCNQCNKLFSDNLFPSKYCPSCGARMDGESDE